MVGSCYVRGWAVINNFNYGLKNGEYVMQQPSDLILAYFIKSSLSVVANQLLGILYPNEQLDAVGCGWMRLDVVGCSWMRLDAVGCSWMRLDAVGCNSTPLDAPSNASPRGGRVKDGIELYFMS